MKSNKVKAATHGECLIVESTIPSNAAPFIVNGTLKIANSETTGNHHLLEAAEGCEFYVLDGTRYMRNATPAKVRCVHENRHDTIEIPAGEWKLTIQQEYDHISQMKRNVMD